MIEWWHGVAGVAVLALAIGARRQPISHQMMPWRNERWLGFPDPKLSAGAQDQDRSEGAYEGMGKASRGLRRQDTFAEERISQTDGAKRGQSSLMEREVHEFHIMEYTALRAQLTQQYQTSFNWLIYIITANAVIASWVSSNTGSKAQYGSLYYVAAALPFLVSIFGHVILFISYRSIQATITYLKSVDRKYGADVGFGRFYDNLKATAKLPSTRGILNGICWIIDGLALGFLCFVIFS